jgi:subtilisin-like proprotein convertase family protein
VAAVQRNGERPVRSGDGRFAFRYFVENAGPSGPNGSYVGLDDVRYTPVSGACCMADGSCSMVNSDACASLNGVYRGDGVTCAQAACPQPGACCLANGDCVAVQAGACAAAGGVWWGPGVVCGGACVDRTCFTVTGLNIPIQDGTALNGLPGADAIANLVIPYFPRWTGDFRINDWISVGVQVETQRQGDLGFRIVHPDSTSVQLVLRPGVTPPKTGGGSIDYGFSNQNFGNTATGQFMTFVDQTPAGVYDSATGFPGPPPGSATGTDNVAGDWTPVGGPMNAAFHGKRLDGTWRLVANDYCPAYTGTIRGIQICAPVTIPSCYANCDGSMVGIYLNVLDFGCFLNKYANGDTGANCDGSTTPPVLNVQDFACYLNAYSAGCSAP